MGLRMGVWLKNRPFSVFFLSRAISSIGDVVLFTLLPCGRENAFSFGGHHSCSSHSHDRRQPAILSVGGDRRSSSS